MLSSIRSRAPVGVCARAVRSYYSSSSSSSASAYGYGYTAYAPVEPAAAWAADSAAAATGAFGCPADNGACVRRCDGIASHAGPHGRSAHAAAERCAAIATATATGTAWVASDSLLCAVILLLSVWRLLVASPLAVVAPLQCMNRNARKPSPANHGARPNSSYNRKRSSPEFGSWRHPGLRPGQTPPPRPSPARPAASPRWPRGRSSSQARRPSPSTSVVTRACCGLRRSDPAVGRATALQ